MKKLPPASPRGIWLASLSIALLCGCNDQAPLPPASINGPRVTPPAIDGVTAPAVDTSTIDTSAAAAKPENHAVEQPAAEDSPSAELFAGWQTPQLALVISGEQMGYIEPCGCAGLENQKGGLGRRHTFFQKLAANNWPVVALDLGNQVRRYGPQQEIKFHTTIDALRTMQYSVVGYGPHDLRLHVDHLLSVASGDESPFVAANVSIVDFEETTPRFRVVERGGRKLGITVVLGESCWQNVQNTGLAYVPAAKALAQVLPKLKQQADVLVLLSHASQDESRALARQFPEFHLVVTAGGADEPPSQPQTIEGSSARLVEVGHKGMYLAVVGLFDDDREPFRFQRVALDKRFEASKPMHDLLAAYQGQLRERGFDDLGAQPRAHRSGNTFVGTQKCAECHSQAYKKWSQTPHSHATETLVNLDPPRQFDPECVSCHAVGWEPQQFIPFKSGFASVKATPHLQGNGCENCHGPGSAHVAAESGEVEITPADQTRLRTQMRLALSAAEAACRACHDLDNSPEFDFEKYWLDVEHRGKD